MLTITVHTDGASRGNPGPSAIAYVIEGVNQEPIKFSQTVGVLPNNQAEYRALNSALEKLLEIDPKGAVISFFADSELMVRQIKGEYRVKNAGLVPLYHQVTDGLDNLRHGGNSYSFTAIPREENKEADRLCNRALDSV